MKLTISTVVTGIVLFVLGGIFYGWLFADYFDQAYGDIMRPQEEMKLWAIALGNLLQAYILSLIYMKYFIKRNSPVRDGLAFGFLMGFLLGAPYVFFTWASVAISWKPILLEGVLIGFMTVVAGMVIGLINGRSTAEAGGSASASAEA